MIKPLKISLSQVPSLHSGQNPLLACVTKWLLPTFTTLLQQAMQAIQYPPILCLHSLFLLVILNESLEQATKTLDLQATFKTPEESLVVSLSGFPLLCNIYVCMHGTMCHDCVNIKVETHPGFNTFTCSLSYICFNFFYTRNFCVCTGMHIKLMTVGIHPKG